ncbi:hypothetical protein CFC21_010618 [Triticum aestivum]|uniref:BHLH domain-containing protein n=2 Tax=Triticum aestivum TaxID=4565 RepID=A0A3B5ZQ17_WHEAT|nr:hypothetical protein CFC21_010618 [Triticum aestivum]
MGLHGSALVWAEGHYNGAIKTRKTVQPAVAQAQAPAPAAEAADQARSRQLRELFDSLAREAAAGGGPGFRDVHGCAQEARRPSAALAPEDLTETEWFYLMSASYSFPPGVGDELTHHLFDERLQIDPPPTVHRQRYPEIYHGESDLLGRKTLEDLVKFDVNASDGRHKHLLQVRHKHGSEVLLGQLLFLIMMHHCGAGGRSSSFYGYSHEGDTKSRVGGTLRLPGRAFAMGGHVWLSRANEVDSKAFSRAILARGKTHTGQPKPEPNKFTPEYDDDEMEYDDNEIDTECASGRSSELMQVEMSERVRDGCSSNLGDEIQMLMVCQNSGDHSNLHGQDEPWHFLYEELCSGYPQSSGEDQAMAENAHYAHTVSLILHRNNALRQSDGPNTRSYLAVSHQSSFSRWDAGIHGRAVAEGTTRQKMLKSVLLFFNAACNKPPGDLRCDDAGARREVDFGASHVMQERKRREKLNERFIVLRSLMDKASILGDTIEYVKQLTKRIQDLESSVARQQVHGDLLVPKGSSERRALMGMEGPSSSSGSSSSAPVATDVQVSIIESDALLELRCPDRRGLLVTIMQALQEQLRLEVTSVQASSDRGVLLAEMRAKVREVHGRRSSISQVKRAIHLIISSG